LYFDFVYLLCYIFFFFQAEDGIRDGHVTGVQTCALPIYALRPLELRNRLLERPECVPECASSPRLRLEVTRGALSARMEVDAAKIGRASCRKECRSRLWAEH